MPSEDDSPMVRLHQVGKVTAEERVASKVLLARTGSGSAFSEQLTDAQERVTRQGCTEPRSMGQALGGFDDLYDDGSYLCACCNSKLYDSECKFDCGCGWPGFWSCEEGAVFAVPDQDGIRSEIRCNSCDAHLGHVLCGEGFGNPAPNERHCVNGCSVSFRPRDEALPVKRCTYDGPVYMYAARQKGHANTTFKDLQRGEAHPTLGADSFWVAINTRIRIVKGFKVEPTVAELAEVLRKDAHVDPDAVLHIRFPGPDDLCAMQGCCTIFPAGLEVIDVVALVSGMDGSSCKRQKSDV